MNDKECAYKAQRIRNDKECAHKALHNKECAYKALCNTNIYTRNILIVQYFTREVSGLCSALSAKIGADAVVEHFQAMRDMHASQLVEPAQCGAGLDVLHRYMLATCTRTRWSDLNT